MAAKISFSFSDDSVAGDMEVDPSKIPALERGGFPLCCHFQFRFWAETHGCSWLVAMVFSDTSREHHPTFLLVAHIALMWIICSIFSNSKAFLYCGSGQPNPFYSWADLVGYLYSLDISIIRFYAFFSYIYLFIYLLNMIYKYSFINSDWCFHLSINLGNEFWSNEGILYFPTFNYEKSWLEC